MKLSRLLGTFTASTLLLMPVGCRQKPVVRPQTHFTVIKLSWWGNDSRNEYTIDAVRKFEELNPDIKVKCSYSEWSGYEARSQVQMASGTEADVMQINFSWLSQYSPDGTGYYDLSKLTDYLDLSTFSEDALSYGMVNGILNAVPIAMNAETVYINKTVYDKYGLSIPQTWDDLFAAADAMKADGVYPLSALAKSAWIYAIAYTEQTNGSSFTNENGEFGFSEEDLETTIDFYVRLVQNKVIPQVEYFSKNDINSGKLAGSVAWVSDAQNYFRKAEENGFEIVAAPYTAFSPAETGSGWYAKPATMYAVSKDTEHPEEAARLLDFLLNSPEMAVLQGVEKGIPLSSSARELLEDKDMLSGLQYDASLVMENNGRLRKMYPVIENTDIIDAFIDSANKVIFGKTDLHTAAAELYNVITSQ